MRIARRPTPDLAKALVLQAVLTIAVAGSQLLPGMRLTALRAPANRRVIAQRFASRLMLTAGPVRKLIRLGVSAGSAQLS